MTKRKESETESENLSTGDVEEVGAALERVLAHAESHGEVYPGAAADHAVIRAVLLSAAKSDAD